VVIALVMPWWQIFDLHRYDAAFAAAAVSRSSLRSMDVVRGSGRY